MAPLDLRKKIGGRVYAKAFHVTSLAESARRYGSRLKSKEVHGTVVDVRVVK